MTTTTKNEKTYRIGLQAVVLVEIDVDATCIEQARGKAFSWTGCYPSGSSEIGDYYYGLDDQDCDGYDERELFWEIINYDPQEVVAAEELEEVEDVA